ncbi:MAG: cytochrome c oxidase accessory protein CcoG [Ignavibacteria bacterium]|nr:cytochrome c oxidase accessory protein CcoG [Ignavibacteria bacterium]
MSLPETDADTFRDTISIVNKKGGRKWVYPKKPHGRYTTARTLLSFILLAALFGLPFIKIDGHPFMLLNVFERKFIIFGTVFVPQDFYLFGLLMISLFVTLFLVTAVFGRIFCGWFCPQTVFLEMVFRKIEYFIEGDYLRQIALNNSEWNANKIFKKVLKYAIFFILSFLIANIFLSYLIGVDQLWKIITEPVSMHVKGFLAVLIFTGIFYFIFAWFREQACILVCPYGRLQSVLLDKNSIVIAYDYIRGEPRGKVKNREEDHLGDCIDCKLCVNVCPTGIDIRNGTQLECVNCTACIDACDSIMDQVDRPRGLIRFDSMEGIKNNVKLKFTPRVIGYTTVLLVLLTTLTVLFAQRKDLDINILRTPGMLFQKQPDNKISNMYNLKVSNKTFTEMPLEFRLIDNDGEIKLIEHEINLKPLEIHEGTLLILLNKEKIKMTNTPLKIEILSGGKQIDIVNTTFLGPQN